MATLEPLPGLARFELPDAGDGSAPGLLLGAELLHLVWMQQADQPSVMHATLARAGDADTWSEPQRIASNPRLLVNWADVPAVGETASGRTVVAWPERHGDEPGAGYTPRIAAQLDDGSFGPPWSPDELRRGPESGFVAFVSTPAGLRMFWLDGRELGPGGHGEGGGSMQLRTVLIDDDGAQLGASLVVDERTCECCKLGVGLLGDRPVAAYRDRSEAEVRDIYVAGPDLAPTRVAADGWTLVGCPVNGPAVASSLSSSLLSGAARLHVAWFTGAEDRSATYVAGTSSLEAWDPPTRFDLGQPGGRIDLIATPDGGALVSWIELDVDTPGRAELLTRRVGADGGLGDAHSVAELGAARDWGFARAALLGDQVVWVFTDPSGERPQLRAWTAPLPAARARGQSPLRPGLSRPAPAAR